MWGCRGFAPIGVKLREGEEFTQQTKQDFCEKIKGRWLSLFLLTGVERG